MERSGTRETVESSRKAPLLGGTISECEVIPHYAIASCGLLAELFLINMAFVASPFMLHYLGKIMIALLPSTWLIYTLVLIITYKLKLTKTRRIVGFFIAWLITTITALLIENQPTVFSAIQGQGIVFTAAAIGAIIAVFAIAITRKRNP